MFKSQYKQDEYCYNKFFKSLETPAFFVEVGASDGVTLSNTYFYEKELNWSGLCIEPRKQAFELLLSNRNCFCENIGISREFESDVKFQAIEGWGQGLSGIVDKYDPNHQNIINNHIVNHPENKSCTITSIDTAPLAYYLKKYIIRHINFLSVDTEGGELDILKSIDWGYTKIDVITIENNYHNSAHFGDYLKEKGFIFDTKLHIDEIYVHKSVLVNIVTKIAFTSSWTSAKYLGNEYKAMLPNKKNWDSLYVVDKVDDADVCVVVEGVNSVDKVGVSNASKLICLPREPSEISPNKEYMTLDTPNKFTYATIHHVVPQFNFLDLHIAQLMEIPYTHSAKNISCIISNKQHTQGAVMRLKFLEQVQAEFPTMIDVYGKGHVEIANKQEALLPYKYSLCMENSQHANYFTEKFTDAIMCWTVPIYWGCPNIDKYFPPNSYYYIDITSPTALMDFKSIISGPITKDNIIALQHARNLIFTEYNIWNTVDNILKEDERFLKN